jgi:hypothetical protein
MAIPEVALETHTERHVRLADLASSDHPVANKKLPTASSRTEANVLWSDHFGKEK